MTSSLFLQVFSPLRDSAQWEKKHVIMNKKNRMMNKAYLWNYTMKNITHITKKTIIKIFVWKKKSKMFWKKLNKNWRQWFYKGPQPTKDFRLEPFGMQNSLKQLILYSLFFL